MEEEEQYITLAEIRDLLEHEEKERKALSMEQKYALTHAQTFAKLDLAKTNELIAELMKVEMMTPANAYKLAGVIISTFMSSPTSARTWSTGSFANICAWVSVYFCSMVSALRSCCPNT